MPSGLPCAPLDGKQRRALLARQQPFEPQAAYFEAFGEPFDIRVADLIDPAYREHVAASLLLQLLGRPQAYARELIE